jgi:hypothetical protein
LEYVYTTAYIECVNYSVQLLQSFTNVTIKQSSDNIQLNINILYNHQITMSLIIENVDNFKHILRILNTKIEGTRTVPYAIEAINGIGRRFGYLICKILRINPRMRAVINNATYASSQSKRLSISLMLSPTLKDVAFPVGS